MKSNVISANDKMKKHFLKLWGFFLVIIAEMRLIRPYNPRRVR